jgi:hypothetical protein
MVEIDWKAEIGSLESKVAALRESLEWALADMDGRATYDDPSHRWDWQKRAFEALRSTEVAAAKRDAQIRDEEKLETLKEMTGLIEAFRDSFRNSSIVSADLVLSNFAEQLNRTIANLEKR